MVFGEIRVFQGLVLKDKPRFEEVWFSEGSGSSKFDPTVKKPLIMICLLLCHGYDITITQLGQLIFTEIEDEMRKRKKIHAGYVFLCHFVVFVMSFLGQIHLVYLRMSHP